MLPFVYCCRLHHNYPTWSRDRPSSCAGCKIFIHTNEYLRLWWTATSPRAGRVLFWDVMQIPDSLWVRGQPPSSTWLCRVSRWCTRLHPPTPTTTTTSSLLLYGHWLFLGEKSKKHCGDEGGYYLNAQTPGPCILIYFSSFHTEALLLWSGFIAGRGKSFQLLSDQGTNFKRSDYQTAFWLQQARYQSVRQSCLPRQSWISNCHLGTVCSLANEHTVSYYK